MAGTYKAGPINYREEPPSNSKGIHPGNLPGHGRHRQQRHNVDRSRLKEQAQQRRVQEAQNFAKKDAPTPTPLFGLPVKRKQPNKDRTVSLIEKVLGKYDEVKNGLDTSVIGVPSQPNTPVTPYPKGKDALFPPATNIKKEIKKEAKTGSESKEKSSEPEIKQEKDRGSAKPSVQPNGAFSSKAALNKDERKGVFDQFEKVKCGSGGEQEGDPSRRSRRDSKSSAERHKDRGKEHSKERSKDRSKDRNRIGSTEQDGSRHSSKPLQDTEKRNASRDRERQLLHERETERIERERQQAELKSSQEKETQNATTVSKESDSAKSQKAVPQPAKNVASASASRNSQKSSSSSSQSNPKPSHATGNDRTDTESAVHSGPSSSATETQKSPRTSKSGGVKTIDSKVVQQQKNSDRDKMKPPNGVINGLIRKQGGGDSSARHGRPKLKMPNESHGQSSLCVEKILQEMSFDPPLTGIQTPKKEDNSRFPFPSLQKDGHSSKSTNSGDAATTASAAAAAAASEAGASVTRHRAASMGAKEGVSLSKELANDLAISSDSDTEDQGPEQNRRSSASEKTRRSPKPSMNSGSKMLESSESSSSGSESSDSGSESESSSSDNEDEKEAKEVVVKKPKSPSPPPPPEPEQSSRSWALCNWKDDMPGGGLPGSEAMAAGPHGGGGDARTIDKNDGLIDILFQENIPDPIKDEMMENKAVSKEAAMKSDTVSSVKMGDKGIFLTISKTRSDAGTPPRSSSRNQSDKAPPSGREMKSPSSVKSAGSSRSSVGRSPGRRSRKNSKTTAASSEREAGKSPKPSPQKANTSTATTTVKVSPTKEHKQRSTSRQNGSKSGAKSSPRSVKTPPRSSERKSGSSTPKSNSRKPQAKSREFLTSSSDSSDEDVDVVNVSPQVKVSSDLTKQGPTTPKSSKSSRSKVRTSSTGSTSTKQKGQQLQPAREPTVSLPAPPARQQRPPPQQRSPRHDGNLSASSTIDLEDVFNAVIGPSTELTAPGPLLSPIPTPDVVEVRKGMMMMRTASPPLSRLPSSEVASEATNVPLQSSSLLSSSSSQPVTAVEPSSPASSSSESDSESAGSESESSDSSGSSRASSRASSPAASPARTQPSVSSVSMGPCTTSTATSIVASKSLPLVELSAPAAAETSTTRVPGLTYVDGKASVMVHLDLSLLSQLPPALTASSTAAATTVPLPLCSLLPPPPPRDVDGAPKKPVAVVEPQQCHIDKVVTDIKMEPSVSGSHLQHGHQAALLLPKDVGAISSLAMNAISADNILANIIKTEDRKPPQTKIPKRKPESDYNKDSHKRPRTEQRSSLNRNTPSRSTPSRNTPNRGTPKRSSDDVSERERTSHEDDHEWDRKYPQRSDMSEDRERRGGSCSSSSSHHSDRDRDHDRDRDRNHDRNRDSKRAKYDRDREHRDREKERKRDRDRERSRDKVVLRDMRMDWDAPNSVEESHTLDGPTFNGSHPAANHWSSLAAGLDTNLDRPSSDNPPDRRHEWRRQEHTEKIESADHYLNEACRLKHQADTLMDRLAKSLMYVEAVLSFIQCGNAMEHERISEPNKIFTMYKDTYTLIRHIYKFRGSHDGEVHDKEKKLSVLSLRIQSLLCLKLFKLKKTETAKFKRVIDDHNKSATQQKAQAPSPYQTNWNRSTGTPSPMSPTPSPAGSVGSVGSVGSGNGDLRLTNGSLAAGTSMSSPSTVSLPQRIHQITQNYISHVNSLVQCHELWEQADGQASEFTQFFQELDYEAGSLTLHSSILDLVRYVRTGLHRLKDT